MRHRPEGEKPERAQEGQRQSEALKAGEGDQRQSGFDALTCLRGVMFAGVVMMTASMVVQMPVVCMSVVMRFRRGGSVGLRSGNHALCYNVT